VAGETQQAASLQKTGRRNVACNAFQLPTDSYDRFVSGYGFSHIANVPESVQLQPLIDRFLRRNQNMAYSDKVLDHYSNPRNVGSMDKSSPEVGTGLVGAPECGDVMKLQIKVNPQTNVIEDAKFKTFGCGSAIASSSLATEWVKGKTVDEALQIKNTEIVKELSLPPVKIHCSVLAEDAIRAAIHDWKKKQDVAQPATVAAQ
jgi:nitrogen fixation NifU-like protein